MPLYKTERERRDAIDHGTILLSDYIQTLRDIQEDMGDMDIDRNFIQNMFTRALDY